MRGKAGGAVFVTSGHGIAPAYAGKSTAWNRSCRARWDHPRVCGEKYLTPFLPGVQMGSPPRMRGKEVCCCVSSPRMGITPAYAGKSCSVVLPVPARWDHPRVCGEKCHACVVHRIAVGSPPRMRGKGRHHFPAVWLQQDHPRVCGEKESGSGS